MGSSSVRRRGHGIELFDILHLNVYGFGQLRERTLILVNRKSAEAIGNILWKRVFMFR